MTAGAPAVACWRVEVADLTAGTVEDRVGQPVEQGPARVGDGDVDDAAVVVRPGPRDEAAFLQSVEQAGDVRGARDQPAREFQRPQSAGVDAAQQAQGVVLLRRQAVRAEQIVLERPQPVVGPPQVQVDFLLRRVEGPAWGFHALRIIGGPEVVQAMSSDRAGYVSTRGRHGGPTLRATS